MTVKAGRDAGGDFRRIEACRSRRQLGCVVAFSAFNGPVPQRGTVPMRVPGIDPEVSEQGVWGRTSEPGLEVLCTDPSKLGRRSGKLKTVYSSEPFAPGTIATLESLAGPPLPGVSTPWLQFKDAYRSECSSAGGASVLQIATSPGARELTPVPDASWGVHLNEVNLALGNLSDLVRRQGRIFVRRDR